MLDLLRVAVGLHAGDCLAALVDCAIKGGVVLAAASGVTGLMRRASAAARHLVWLLAVVSLLLLPVLTSVLPGWRVLPASIGMGAKVDARAASGARAVTARSGAAPWARDVSPAMAGRADAILAEAPVRQPHGKGLALVAPVNRTAAQHFAVGWRVWVLLVWALGAIAALAPLVVASAVLRRVERECERLTEGEEHRVLMRAARELGLGGRPVALLRSGRHAMPMTWGVFKARVLLPGESRSWEEPRIRVVLLHELAHVRRGDCLAQWVTQLACALHWFNPLAWVAIRAMRAEQERACDDLVLSCGAHGPDYAEQLLDVVETLRRRPLAGAAAIFMARRTQLEGRVGAILDPTLSRRRLTRRAVVAAGVLVAILMVPLAILKGGAGEGAATGGAASGPAGSNAPAAGEKSQFDRFGRVVDVKGKGVAGAVLSDRTSGWSATCDADGRFEPPPMPGLHSNSLSIAAKEFAPREDLTLFRTGEGKLGPEGGVIVLHRAGRLEGRVIGPDGNPLAGAPMSISLVETYPSSSNLTVNRMRGISDEEGRFVIEDVPPGEMVLVYPWTGPTQEEVRSGRWKKWMNAGKGWPSAPVKGVASAIKLELADGQTIKDVVLDLSQSVGVAEGRVVDSGHVPLGGARVHLTCQVRGGTLGVTPEGLATTRADDAGRFRLEQLPLGSWHLQAWVEETSCEPVAVELSRETARAGDMVLPLERGPGGRLRRNGRLEPPETVVEWARATVAGDAEWAGGFVAGEGFSRSAEAFKSVLPKLEAARFGQWSTSGDTARVEANPVKAEDGRPITLEFRLVRRADKWLLEDVQEMKRPPVGGEGAGTMPATGPSSLPASSLPAGADGGAKRLMLFDVDEAQRDTALDLDTQRVVSVPDDVMQDRQKREAWLDEQGIDLQVDHAGEGWGLLARHTRLTAISPEEWETGGEPVGDVVRRVTSKMVHRAEYDIYVLGKAPALPATFVFRTSKGQTGLLQVTAVHADQPKHIELRVRADGAGTSGRGRTWWPGSGPASRAASGPSVETDRKPSPDEDARAAPAGPGGADLLRTKALLRDIVQRQDAVKRQEGIAEVLKLLEAGSARERATALTVLIAARTVPFDRQAAGQLVRKCLGDTDAGVRWLALMTMATSDTKEDDLPAIVKLADDPDATVRSEVLAAVVAATKGKGGDEASAVALKLLGDPSDVVRKETLRATWGVKLSEAVDAKMIELLRDPKSAYDVVYYGLSTRPLMSRAVCEQLIRVMRGEVPGVGQDSSGRATWGLSHHPLADDARERVTDALVKEVDETLDPYVRDNAVYGLRQLGGAAAIAKLKDLAEHDENPEIRRKAAGG